MAMGISVIIPCRNQCATLERAVKSAQFADEIIVVNDASTDSTREISTRLRETYNLRVLHTGARTPAGVCHARNLGIHHAEGDLILPLDADDWLRPETIDLLKTAYEGGFFVYGEHIVLENGEQRLITPPPLGMITRKNITTATFLFSRADWERVGGYNPAFNLGAEDHAFMLALLNAGVKARFVPQPLFYYTASPNGRAAQVRERWTTIHHMMRQYYPRVFENVEIHHAH